ncbi:MAG: hypothetical protein HYT72_02570 [Candidatus Aenigmarchaeota archaeon]|nr:hypothetical protein [Candidatus Aenigmarchaeota archaeon]
MTEVITRRMIEVRHDGQYFWLSCPSLGNVFSTARTYPDALQGFYKVVVDRARSLVMNIHYGWHPDASEIEYIRFVFENKSRLHKMFTPVYTMTFSQN